jgi:hypothetical protein
MKPTSVPRLDAAAVLFPQGAYAVLSGGSHMHALIEQSFNPMCENHASPLGEHMPALQRRPVWLPWMVMAYTIHVMSYVTMAPRYQGMLGIDPFSATGTRYQVERMRILTQLFRAYQGPAATVE